MFKELDKITTLGLVDKKTTGMDLFEEMMASRLGKNVHFSVDKDIHAMAIDRNFKSVDERLLPLIGVYELSTIAQPYWVEEFITMFTSYATLESLLVEKRYSPINTDVKCSDYYDMLSELNTALKSANYVDGTIKDKSDRSVKILKHIKQQLNKFVVISDTEFEKADCVKHYMKYKESKKCMYLVITPAIASILGMSSYAPEGKNPNNGKNRVWTSCMSGGDGNVSTSVIANLFDKNSLLCYVCDETTATCSIFQGVEKYRHHAMMSRTMLRLFCDSKNNNPTIVLDRAYPHSMYTEAIYTTLAQLIQGTKLRLGVFDSYNTTQSGKDMFSSVMNRITKNCVRELLTPPHAITTVVSANCKNSCADCGNRRGSKCKVCALSAECTNGKQCKNCDKFVRNASVHGAPHYDDQGGSRTTSTLDSGASYRDTYRIYTNIERNIEIPEKETQEKKVANE